MKATVGARHPYARPLAIGAVALLATAATFVAGEGRAAAQLPPNRFASLTAGQSVSSTNGQYHFIMQTDGNAVLRGPGNHALFNTGTAGNPGASIMQQDDGNLVVRSATHKALWSNGVRSATPMNDVVTDYGAVVTTDGHQSWSSGSLQVTPGDGPGSPAVAADGAIRLLSQSDDNLVEYVNGRAVWSTQTRRHAQYYPELINQTDGNTVLIEPLGGSKSVALWSTHTSGHSGATFIIQADTNLVVYSSTGAVLWSRF